jgi:hypothetical protein
VTEPDAVVLVTEWMRRIEDGVQDAVAQREAAMGPVSCRRCTEPACCRQVVTLGLPEAILIANALGAAGRDTPALRASLARDAADQGAWGRRRWLESGRSCALLDGDGRCSVYEVRPVACRALWSVSPPEDCGKDFDGEVATLNVQNPAGKASQMFSSDFGKVACGGRGDRVYQDLLPRAVLAALRARGRRDALEYLGRQSWPSAEWYADFKDKDRRPVDSGG